MLFFQQKDAEMEDYVFSRQQEASLLPSESTALPRAIIHDAQSSTGIFATR